MEQILFYLVQNYPGVTGYLLAASILRQIFKPTFTLFKYLADKTETNKDDQVLAKVQDSIPYKVVSYVLDHTASIKLSVMMPDKYNKTEP